MSRLCCLPSSSTLALENFTVHRASRSFCLSFAGLSFQESGILPALISAFSSSVFLCLGGRHHRCVDDLPTHGQMPGLGEVLVETGEQILHRTGLHEMFPKQPDRLGVRHVIASPRPRKRMNNSRSWIWNSA